MYIVDVKTPKPMLMNITIIVFSLVAINFLLLKFSVNKIVKPNHSDKKPLVLHPEITTEFEKDQLAPTGS